MQIYKSPGGTQYLVFRGVVYFKPSGGGEVRQSDMPVSRFLKLIEGCLLKFHRTTSQALAYGAEHWKQH